MGELDIEPVFSSVCSSLVLNEETETEDVLEEIANAGEEHLFRNRRVEIKEDDIKESEIEFSTGDLRSPQYNEWSYLVVNFYSEPEDDRIHIHSYFQIENVEQVDEFYERIMGIAEEIQIDSVEADVHIDLDVSELGFTYIGDSDLSLEGVRFTQDSEDFSLYSAEDGSIIRGGFTEPLGTLDEGGYESFVKAKLDEIQSVVGEIPS